MKKMTLFLLTALVLASVFAGCSASAYMDDPYAGGYSNVSTTRSGTVNGTNGRYTGYGYYDGNTAYNGTYNGTYSAYPNAGTTRSTTTTTNGRTGTAAGTGSYTGTTSGTGMTGGR